MMERIHFLNVHPGDCTIIEHSSGNVTLIDICDGNFGTPLYEEKLAQIGYTRGLTQNAPGGNFKMCQNPTNPIDYIQTYIRKRPFRFILSHPDADHLDGFDRLVRELGITNFWDSSVRREKPQYAGSPYLEQDWDTYERVRNGLESGTKSIRVSELSLFAYANRGGPNGNGDGLWILAPNDDLIQSAIRRNDINDASFVILFISPAGKVVLPGDAHNETWDYVLRNFGDKLENSLLLLAPHHGRHSGRQYDFLDQMQPRFTWIGCAESQHIRYDRWRTRELDFLTSNQTGNTVFELDASGMSVYIENPNYASKLGANVLNPIRSREGYIFVGRYYK